MTTTVEDLSRQARSLSTIDRARLAEEILASLDGEPDDDVERAWDLEIQGRLQQVKDGTATLVSADEVHAQARQIYK